MEREGMYQQHYHHGHQSADQQNHHEQHPNYHQHHLYHQNFNRHEHFNHHFADPSHGQQFNNQNQDYHNHSNYEFNQDYPSNYEPNQHMNGAPIESFGGGGFRFNGRKRSRYHSASGHNDGGGHAKLYVAPVSRMTTELEIHSLFEEHGRVVEVIIPWDKWNSPEQGYCFVKYATIDEAERAIRALNNQYTFPGVMASIKVRYADGERERHVAFSVDGSVDKLYVGCVNKQASKQEIEQDVKAWTSIKGEEIKDQLATLVRLMIFSPYGLVEDVYIARDVLKQSRGCAFVKFSHREMALAAIKGLNGNFTMRGCDQPLVVRFADPKKPRAGDMRAPTNCGDFVGGNNLPNGLFGTQDISANLQPQSVPQMAKQEQSTPHGTEQPCPPVDLLPQLSQMPQQRVQTPISSMSCQQQHMQTPLISSMPCKQAESEVQRQVQNLEQQQSTRTAPKSSWTESNPQATSTSSGVPPNPQTEDSHECDWSEHTCPDGYKYYYNCLTYESRWEKPEEFTLFQQFLLKQQMLDAPKLSSVFSAIEIDRRKKNLDHEQLQSESSPVVDPTCV